MTPARSSGARAWLTSAVPGWRLAMITHAIRTRFRRKKGSGSLRRLARGDPSEATSKPEPNWFKFGPERFRFRTTGLGAPGGAFGEDGQAVGTREEAPPAPT